jgi:hypothetical protein
MIWIVGAALAAQVEQECEPGAREAVRDLAAVHEAWQRADSDSREQTWTQVFANPDAEAKEYWQARHERLTNDAVNQRAAVAAMSPDPHGVHAAVLAGLDLRIAQLEGPELELIELKFALPIHWDTVLEAEALVAGMHAERDQAEDQLGSALDTHVAQCGSIPPPPEGETPAPAVKPFEATAVAHEGSPLSDAELLGFAMAHHNGAVGVHNAMVEATWGWTGTVREFHQAQAEVVAVLEAARAFAEQMGPFAGSNVLADGLLGMAEAHLVEMNGRGIEIADLRGALIVTGGRYRKADELWNQQRKAFREAEQIFDDAVHSFRNDWSIQEYLKWYRDEIQRKG